MAKKLTATVDKIVSQNKNRLRVLAVWSTSDLIDEAQKPTAKGGNMRVKTGFLRASGQISLNGLPSGPVRGNLDNRYNTRDGVVKTALGRFVTGATIYFGWTAGYARARNTYDGFLDLAVQNWQSIVKRNAAKIRKSLK